MSIDGLPASIQRTSSQDEDIIVIPCLRVRVDVGVLVFVLATTGFFVGMVVWMHHGIFAMLNAGLTAKSIIIATVVFWLLQGFRDNPFLELFLRLLETETIRILNDRLYLERRSLFRSSAVCIMRDELKQLIYERPGGERSFYSLRLTFQQNQEEDTEELAFGVHRRHRAALFHVIRRILEEREWQVEYLSQARMP